MSQPAESRHERKERTRQAILDASLRISAQSSFAALSLRQVTREVGIVPTAFYRHFATLDELGLALVDASFASLRSMLRAVRQGNPALSGVIAGSVAILVEHAHQHREHFRFIARERFSGTPVVRDAIRHELELFERELATDLARLPNSSTWSAEDLRIMANLVVTAMVSTAEAVVSAPAGRPDVERQIVATAEQQLRMIVVGAAHWQSRG
ncbi:MAG: TetR family transcriptional regulator [Nocardioidaceae bacterium]